MVRLLQAVAGVIAMSDPDDEAFADSAADCLEALLPGSRLSRASGAGKGRTVTCRGHLHAWRFEGGNQAYADARR
jgi:hypothetical protein